MLKLISMIGSVIDKAQKDHVTAFSAQAAFFTILSFFPFMIVLLSLTRYFPITPNDMIELVRTYLPPKYSGMVVPIFKRKTYYYVYVDHNSYIIVVCIQRDLILDDWT